MSHFRWLIAAVLIMAAPWALADYPDRPIKFVVPFSGGSATDSKIALYLDPAWADNYQSPLDQQLRAIIEKLNTLFEGDLTDDDQLVYVNHVIMGKLLESARLVQQATTGANAGGVVFPSVPLDVQTLGFSPEQMSLEQMPKLPEERITAVLGIPAITVGVGAGLDQATYANFREAREAAVEVLERDGRGLNLTREVRDGIRYHTGPVKPATLEGQIVRLVDRIAYVNHDIDDAAWAALARHLDESRLIAFTLLVGQYDSLATTIGTLRIQRDVRR